MYLQRIIAILTALVVGTHQLFVSAIAQPTPYSIKESESQLYHPNIKEESLEETVEDLSTQEKPWMSVTEMFQFANANRDIASKYKQLVGLRNDIE